MALRKVTKVREKTAEGILPRREKRYHHFAIGTSKSAPKTLWISEEKYEEAKKLQSSKPVSVGMITSGKTTWYKIRVRNKVLWWYKNEFYVEGEKHSPGKERKEGVTGLTRIRGVHEETRYSYSSRDYEKGYCFEVGSATRRSPVVPYTYPWISKTEYKEAKKLQSSKPVSVGTVRGGKEDGKTLWWYKDGFCVEDEGYSSEQVQLLLWDRERKQKRKFERLKKEMLSEHALEQARRERIPEDVRIFVWKRDGGKCVNCGSQENLEFDHIIPVSKGGSSTARNIQLLCETCNRQKSDKI